MESSDTKPERVEDILLPRQVDILADKAMSDKEKVAFMNEVYGWKSQTTLVYLSRLRNQDTEDKYPMMEFEGKRVSVHRVVVYQTTGDWYYGMTVHHINGNRSDNRPENLYLCSQEIHQRFHSGMIENPEIGNLYEFKKVK